ncbi:glycine cleavage system protein H [Methylophilus aquaticus]|uniref:Glycine cleavage system H protein n=1 Tax=Methylophilus aquaticus TaxID=1971610 RepID=A0ABT9JPM3_9PROT|nr:glycine cleavage system H protein [Methylophilus aquaticus]MDP8566521.1 glycine cleavage system H protein [Methylophilus aquaticus]
MSQYFFSKDHTWAARSDDGAWLIGITDYAQNMLGDVVFVDPPELGQSVQQFAVCGLVESVKTGSDLYAPLSGRVLAINEEVLANPEKLNDDPYRAWIFKLASDASGEAELLNEAAYQQLL